MLIRFSPSSYSLEPIEDGFLHQLHLIAILIAHVITF